MKTVFLWIGVMAFTHGLHTKSCDGRNKELPSLNEAKGGNPHLWDSIPKTNQKILEYVQKYGPEIAPTYEPTVCTEYVIKVLEHFKPLNKKQKNQIRIITDKNLDQLIQKNDPVIKGVYTCLVTSGLGTPIDDLKQAKPGDFFQFWDSYWGFTYGHCGVLVEINLEQGYIKTYSSAPNTHGHGLQTYPMPPHLYVVRML